MSSGFNYTIRRLKTTHTPSFFFFSKGNVCAIISKWSKLVISKSEVSQGGQSNWFQRKC